MLNKVMVKIKRARLPRESLAAVHDDDLTAFLTSIGAIHDINAGRIRCKFCGEPISLENLQAVLPDSGSISYICNKTQCIRDFLNYTREVDGN